MNLLYPSFDTYKESIMGSYSRWNGSVFHLRTFVLEFSGEDLITFSLHVWLFE